MMEKFYRQVEQQLAPFVLYGSGDFHHLSALWLRRLSKRLSWSHSIIIQTGTFVRRDGAVEAG